VKSSMPLSSRSSFLSSLLNFRALSSRDPKGLSSNIIPPHLFRILSLLDLTKHFTPQPTIFRWYHANYPADRFLAISLCNNIICDWEPFFLEKISGVSLAGDSSSWLARFLRLYWCQYWSRTWKSRRCCTKHKLKRPCHPRNAQVVHNLNHNWASYALNGKVRILGSFISPSTSRSRDSIWLYPLHAG